METKLEVIRYLESDVIVTSCISDGMSPKSYDFSGDNYSCGWDLNGAGLEMQKKSFKYYDENGVSTTLSDWQKSTDWGLNGIYFHYKKIADDQYEFEICTNSQHHYDNDIPLSH